MGLDPSNWIVVSGDYGLYRFSPAGQVDTAFGTSGRAFRVVNPYSTGQVVFDDARRESRDWSCFDQLLIDHVEPMFDFAKSCDVLANAEMRPRPNV